MTAADHARFDSSPYGRAGLPWWATLLVALAVLLPSTGVLILPALAGVGYLPVLQLVAMVIVAIGVSGAVFATIGSVLCKPFGWWPVPAALIVQWVVAWMLYSMVW